MRLKSLWVDGFKNLNDFEINFENRDGITVLIGNNASGKSNILEAISAIFAGLYNNQLKPKFNYEIEYKTDAPLKFDVKIKLNNKKYSFTLRDEKGVLFTKGYQDISLIVNNGMPSQIIALYSGEELRLWGDCYSKSYINFFNNLKKYVNAQIPKMLYIDKYSWDIGLITLFCWDFLYESPIKTFLKKNFKIDLNSGIDVSFSIDERKYEKLKNNEALLLIKRIKNLSDKNGGKINTNTLKSLDIGTQQITAKQIFSYLYITSSPIEGGKLGAKTTKIINDIKIDQIDIKSLSEGQKKQILLKLALEVLANKNSLLLFDEPDAHIHISNKKLIPEMLKGYGNREIILTTHSPTLAHSFDNKHIAMLGKDDEENAIIIEADKQEIISQLTNDIWSYHEQGLFFSSKDLVLLVEGNNDKKHIETALDKLKNDNDYSNLEFSIFSLNGAQNIQSFMSGIKSSIIRDKKKTYIGIFDYDSEGRKCSEIVDSKKNGTIKTYCKLLKDNEDKKQGVECGYYHMYLPYNDASKDFKIEQMYSDSRQKEAYEYSVKNMTSGFNAKTIESKAKKYLADNRQDFDLQDFDKFKTLFDLILEIKPHE